MNILLMYSTHEPSKKHLERLQEAREDVHVYVAHSEEEAIQLAEKTEIIFGHRYLKQVMPNAQRLKWVQSTAGGADRLPLEVLSEKDVILSRCTLFADVVAQYAIRLADALLTRKVEDFLRPYQSKWYVGLSPLPTPKKAIVVGMGHVGREIAKILKGRGLFVIGASRSGKGLAESFCDVCYDADTWSEYLAEVGLCFLALPHTRETGGLFDEVKLRSLPKEAVLVNIGRGETLQTDALMKVLKEGHLGGAGLDVIDPEPTSETDSIWRTPRLLITPRIGAHFPGRGQTIEAYFEEQLKRYLSQEALEDVVDLDGGVN